MAAFSLCTSCPLKPHSVVLSPLSISPWLNDRFVGSWGQAEHSDVHGQRGSLMLRVA